MYVPGAPLLILPVLQVFETEHSSSIDVSLGI
jgi:hypothetical protein